MTLRNTYYALRHGTSLANERGIVVSHPENGVAAWGLSESGQRECRLRFAAGACVEPALVPATTYVYTSDFARAIETALLLCEGRGLQPFRVERGLRERCFGTLEMGSVRLYDEVWRRDALAPNHGYAGAESTEAVAERMLAVVARVEREHTGATIVLVSHGDPLQILETVLGGLPSHRHRECRHLGNAEIRPIRPIRPIDPTDPTDQTDPTDPTDQTD